MKPLELAQAVARALNSKQGQDVLVIDVRHLTSVTDYFVIASGRNVLQVRALAEAVEDQLEAAGETPRRREGYADARWIVLDYASVIVHMFHVDERAYYNIERLWMDGANVVAVPDVEDA